MTLIDRDSFKDPRRWLSTGSVLLFFGLCFLLVTVLSPLVDNDMQTIRDILTIGTFAMGAVHVAVGIFMTYPCSESGGR